MSTIHLEPLLRHAERRAVLLVLHQHPEWTLGQVLRELEQNGPRAAVLRELTLGELFDDPGDVDQASLSSDGGPPVDAERLRAAKTQNGADFDECVREVIAAAGTAIGASYLRARVGGPRWKLQSSLRRLVDAAVVERSGTTSGTRYKVAQ
jgi:hypothetical protein